MSIFSLHVGQFGTRIGEEYWAMMEADTNNVRSKNYFNETSYGLTPRCLITDFDNSVIEELKSNKSKFSQSETVTGLYSDTGSWAYGQYSGGSAIIGNIKENFTKEIEKCENLKAVQYFSGISGAAGGGLSTMMLWSLKSIIPDTPIIGIHVLPDVSEAFSPIEIINTLLSFPM